MSQSKRYAILKYSNGGSTRCHAGFKNSLLIMYTMPFLSLARAQLHLESEIRRHPYIDTKEATTTLVDKTPYYTKHKHILSPSVMIYTK